MQVRCPRVYFETHHGAWCHQDHRAGGGVGLGSAGHDVTCLVRPRSEQRAEDGQDLTRPVAVWIGEVTDARSFAEDIIAVSNSLSGVLRRLPNWGG